MRAASVNSSMIQDHKWRDLTAGAYLGHVERAAEELDRANRQLQAATTKRNNAEQRLREERDRAAALKASGAVVPLTPDTD